VDIIITKDNLQTLVDVVIVDLTCTNLVQHVSTTTYATWLLLKTMHASTQGEH
jgi:hypothetical protein